MSKLLYFIVLKPPSSSRPRHTHAHTALPSLISPQLFSPSTGDVCIQHWIYDRLSHTNIKDWIYAREHVCKYLGFEHAFKTVVTLHALSLILLLFRSVTLSLCPSACLSVPLCLSVFLSVGLSVSCTHSQTQPHKHTHTLF